MLPKIVLTLILLPLIELAIFIKLGPVLGLWPIIGIIIGSAFFGLIAGQFAGLRALHRIQATLAKGELPGNAILDAGLILVASICLFVPGLLTTLIGLLLLIPPLRIPIKYLLRKKLAQSIASAGPSMLNSPPFAGPFRGGFQQSNLLHDHMHSANPYDAYDHGYSDDDQGEIIDITPSNANNSDTNHPKDENQ